jgi:hypothetical protein
MSMMRPLLAGTLAAISLAFAAAATAQTAARPEVKVGNTWTYQFTGPGFSRTEVHTVTEALASGGFRYMIDDKSQGGAAAITGEKAEAKERTMRVSADLNPMLRDPLNTDKLQEFVRLQWPLEPGKSWSFPINGANNPFTWDVKAGGWESVTVPAGTFKALKLSFTRSGGRTTGSEDAWYAPEAKGIVKRLTHYSSTERRNQIDNTTIELTSYKVD